MVPFFVCLMVALAGSFTPVRGQEEAPPLTLEAVGAGAPLVQLGDLLADPSLREALESGLPLRAEVVVGLWRDGFFDSQVGQARWEASFLYDPLGSRFVVVVDSDEAGGPPPVRQTFSTLDGVRATFPRLLETDLRPDEEGSFYYLGRLSVETLSLSDLEELQRWLRGELAPAISGDRGVDSALERGLRRAMIRLLGMPARRFDARTPTFEVPPEEDEEG